MTLDIVQEVNNVSGTTEISGNSIPTISARKIKTTVSVANEATIALGGLVQESVEDASSGIPILHRMPVIGPLFGNTKKKKRRTELIVLLRPTVIYDPSESSLLAEREQEKLNFPPDLEASLDHSAEQFFSHEPKEKPKQPAATRPAQRPPRFVPATRQ